MTRKYVRASYDTTGTVEEEGQPGSNTDNEMQPNELRFAAGDIILFHEDLGLQPPSICQHHRPNSARRSRTSSRPFSGIDMGVKRLRGTSTIGVGGNYPARIFCCMCRSTILLPFLGEIAFAAVVKSAAPKLRRRAQIGDHLALDHRHSSLLVYSSKLPTHFAFFCASHPIQSF